MRSTDKRHYLGAHVEPDQRRRHCPKVRGYRNGWAVNVFAAERGALLRREGSLALKRFWASRASHP